MKIRAVTSQVDGEKHRENMRLIRWVVDSNSANDFRGLAGDLVQDTDNVIWQGSTDLGSKTILVADQARKNLLVVAMGSQGNDNRDALVNAFRTAPNRSEGSAAPYWEGSASPMNCIDTTLSGVYDTVTLVGHSYGGAMMMALNLRLRLAQDVPHLYTYTYGTPRYGYRTFGNRWANQWIAQVYASFDPVVLIPPTRAEDILFDQYVGLISPLTFVRVRANLDNYYSPMSWYNLSSLAPGVMTPTTLAGAVVRAIDSPVSLWLSGHDAFGAAAHSLSHYTSLLSLVPVVDMPSRTPMTVPIASPRAPRPSQAVVNRQISEALVQAGIKTELNVESAIQQTQEAIVNVPNVIYRKTRIGKFRTISYAGQMVLVCKGKRDQKRICRSLNKNLRESR